MSKWFGELRKLRNSVVKGRSRSTTLIASVKTQDSKLVSRKAKQKDLERWIQTRVLRLIKFVQENSDLLLSLYGSRWIHPMMAAEVVSGGDAHFGASRRAIAKHHSRWRLDGGEACL